MVECLKRLLWWRYVYVDPPHRISPILWFKYREVYLEAAEWKSKYDAERSDRMDPDLKSIFRGLNLILSITVFKLLHLDAISQRSLFSQPSSSNAIRQFDIAKKTQTFLVRFLFAIFSQDFENHLGQVKSILFDSKCFDIWWLFAFSFQPFMALFHFFTHCFTLTLSCTKGLCWVNGVSLAFPREDLWGI